MTGLAEIPTSSRDHPAVAGLREHLSAAYALTQSSSHVFASPLGPFVLGGQTVYLPRFMFFGPQASNDSWRLAFLGGFDRGDVTASRALLRLIGLLAGSAQAGHGLHLAFYPVVDAAGVLGGAPPRDLRSQSWSASRIPEIGLLERDARRCGYHGFVRVETGEAGENVAVVQVNGFAFSAFEPDLEIVTSEDEETMPVRFEAAPARPPHAGPLTIAEDLPQAPFELIVKLPGAWPAERCEEAAARFLQRFLGHYRAFQAYGQHL